jgi:membrane fusion protein (multidrug efflux system)
VLVADAYKGQSFYGTVNAINPKVDPTTRNVQMEATIPNPKRLLLPGMFATVSVQSGGEQRYLTLPQTAITYNPYGSTVFILRPKSEADAEARAASGAASAGATKASPAASAAGDSLVAQQVFVTAGETRGDQVAVLKGLKEGQTVVTSGQVKLKNNTPVVVDNSVLPANSPNPKPQEQ